MKKMGRPKQPDNKIAVVHARVPAEVEAKLEAVAKRRDTSISALIRKAIADVLRGLA